MVERRRRAQKADAVAEPEEPVGHRWGTYGLLLLILLGGLVLRLPAFVDEAHYFKHFADEATYFTTAYHGYLNGPEYPLPQGGSGLSLGLEWVLRISGVHGGDAVPQPRENATYQLTPDQLVAGRIAHAGMLGSNLLFIVATFTLARTLLGRTRWALLPPALVAVAPYQVTTNMWFLTEPLFFSLVLFAINFVLKAKRTIGYLYAAAACLVGAHMLRVNGLFVFVALGVFAFFHVRDRLRTNQGLAKHLAGYVASFFGLSLPYLMFRGDSLPGPFDYGVNERFWADGNLFDFNDNYWKTYAQHPQQGGDKETMHDYFAKHTLGDAAARLWASMYLPFTDTFSLSWAPETTKVFSGIETVLCAGVVAYGFAKRLLDRTVAWLLLTGFLVCWLPTIWMYPIVRNPTFGNPRFFLLWAPLLFIAVADVLRKLPRNVALAIAGVGLVGVLSYTVRAVPLNPALLATWASRGFWVVTWTLLPVLAWLAWRIPEARQWWRARRSLSP